MVPQIHIDFETDPNLLTLQDSFPEEFFLLFEKGVQVCGALALCPVSCWRWEGGRGLLLLALRVSNLGMG
jgi:hypothetical protein